MQSIILQRLVLRNFKGIREFTLDTSGGDVAVFGDNATGKTTLFDAFLWLLFGKDSNNSADFELKTLGPDGEPLHGLDHEVEAEFTIDGKRKTFRRVFREKWTKKRGSATAEFTGHTTDYYVDGVPVKEKEYRDEIASILDESVFRLLTNPTYFSEVLKPEQRRKILLEVCGDVSDDDVIAANSDLSRLPEILEGRTIEKHRAMVAERRKRINEELQKIPIRIDEAMRAKADVEEDEASLRKTIEAKRQELAEKEERLTMLKAGGALAEKERRKAELEAELARLEAELSAELLKEIEALQRKAADLREDRQVVQWEIRQDQQRAEQLRAQAREKTAEADRLRQEWRELNAQTFVPASDEPTVCPACGQAIPEERIAEARRKAEAEFNRQKAERLEAITKAGKEAVAEAKRLAGEAEGIQKLIEQGKAEEERLQREIASIEEQIAQKKALLDTIKQDERYVAKLREREALEKEILSLRSERFAATEDLHHEIVYLRGDISLLEKQLAALEQAKAIDERIEELKRREKELAAEFERLEHELFLCEEFVRTKVRLLEDRINSRFKLARFKLFEQQINGGIAETCEVTYNGVPYSSLNHAAKINVGLDIANTLAEHYGVAAPIFVDNAEAVTQLIETHGQQIRLVVSAADKKLRVETSPKTMKEAV